MDLLDHLTQEHRRAEQLMARLSDSQPGPDRDRMVDELEEALAVHMAVEEQFLYPLATEAVGAEAIQEATAEHGLARTGLATLREMAHQPGFGAALDMVEAGVGHHVTEEEDELFPQLRASSAAAAIASLDPEALEAAAGRTRDELYEEARRRGIEGRSRMTKAELADAVAGRPDER